MNFIKVQKMIFAENFHVNCIEMKIRLKFAVIKFQKMYKVLFLFTILLSLLLGNVEASVVPKTSIGVAKTEISETSEAKTQKKKQKQIKRRKPKLKKSFSLKDFFRNLAIKSGLKKPAGSNNLLDILLIVLIVILILFVFILLDGLLRGLLTTLLVITLIVLLILWLMGKI